MDKTTSNRDEIRLRSDTLRYESLNQEEVKIDIHKLIETLDCV